MFLKNPGFAVSAIAALALGIGANAAIFSVVNTVLLKPLTYPDPDRIVQFLLTSPQGEEANGSVPKYFEWKRQDSVFQDVAAYSYSSSGMNLIGGALPEQIKGIHVSADYFRLFGANVVSGRTFNSEEDQPHGRPAAVISEALWRRRYGADSNMIGKAIDISGESYTVVGIIGSRFNADPAAEVWLPFQLDPNSHDQSHYFLVAGRLKPGVTVDAANAQLLLAASDFRRRFGPDALRRTNGFRVRPLRDSIVGDVKYSLLVLLGAVSFVLLIACANVANLFLIRATARRREIAIRAAVGAGRGRIIRQLLTESVLLSLVGGLLGLVLGTVAVRALLALNPGNIPRIGEDGSGVTLDWRVLAFTIAVSLSTGILFGLIPALDASRADLSVTLKEGGGRTGSGFRQNRMRSILVVSEVSLAIVLLIGAALLIRTYLSLRTVNPGFDPHHVLTTQMSLTGPRFAKTGPVVQMTRPALDRVEAIPGVAAAATAFALPLEGGFRMPVTVLGRPLKEGPYHAVGGWDSVSARYFEVFRIPLVKGRYFNIRDDAASARVVIINQAMARKLWPDSSPLNDQVILGKGLGPAFDEAPRQVIGVVGDVRDSGLNKDGRPGVYIPASQEPDGITALVNRIGSISWIVRAQGGPLSVSKAVQEELRKASGGIPVNRVRSLDEVVGQSTARSDFNMLLLTIFGASALLLAAIGIYGLMAYSVEQRTQELGIRMALGAQAADVRKLVLTQVMRLAGIGVLIGTGSAFWLTRLISSMLYGVKDWDPMVFFSVPVVLVAVALVAAWAPARRATRIDPIAALRHE